MSGKFIIYKVDQNQWIKSLIMPTNNVLAPLLAMPAKARLAKVVRIKPYVQKRKLTRAFPRSETS
jgi:hypothetical protein